MKIRNLLFAPGDSERKAAKALASSADGVILDLEDSVAPAEKPSARRLTVSLLRASPREGRIVRVNPRGTEWYLADVAAAVEARAQAVLLPKCTGPDDLAALDHHLEALETAAGLAVGGILVLALVTETARSLRRLDYDGVPRLAALCFAAEDLSADLGIAPRNAGGRHPAPVEAARAAVLIAAGAAGVAALDTPWPDPRDADGLVREAEAAATDGFAGKLCIHPGQIEAVKAAFTPAPERVRWARAVRDAFAANPGAGVLTLDGKMLDRPHLRLAERILATAD